MPSSCVRSEPQPDAGGRLTLHTRLSLLLTAVVASLMLVLGGLWLSNTRDSIHEEVEAATRVCEQWLNVLAGEARAVPSAGDRLLADIKAVGRIRANALEVIDGTGQRIYLSPQPTYKAGRASPAWFARITEPVFVQRRIAAGSLTLILTPDPSRAGLDAWDSLSTMAAWACALLASLFTAARWALNRALHPLDQIKAALERTGLGRFDTRLPVYASRDLNRLATAFNGMADRLNEAVNDNVRLDSERELSRLLQARLEAERRSIAQELHDELAQGITAVRALAGAIVQRTTEHPALHAHAQSIIAVTNQIQEGIRHILQRLRPLGNDAATDLQQALQHYLELWQQHYPDLTLHADIRTGTLQVGDALALAVLRIIQEGLTNVVRHAAAAQVQLTLHTRQQADGEWLELTLADNGRGLCGTASGNAGCGFGLTGMRERVAALQGELSIASMAGGGTCLRARLPANRMQASQASQQT
ncbi:ATP-binding protein [Herminiimonas sp. CN]|uniref:ATP-binding protein n=1 Tax=Herminiimonas sp. CN TaxID=1349818 RepID=UPI0004731A18|nr:ATP-binding protein [Herminiimonas sp. CN]